MTATAFLDPDPASAAFDAVTSTIAAVRAFQAIPFWKLSGDQLLALGRDLEQLSRLLYTAQIHPAGELDTGGHAATRSCSCTAALLRQAFTISPAEATGRVKAARQVLPQESISGAEAPPLLPVLADALAAGQLDPEHIRTIIDTMRKMPPTRWIDPEQKPRINTLHNLPLIEK